MRGIGLKAGRVLAAVFTAVTLITGSVGAAPSAEVFAFVQPEELTYNSGHRDEVCTQLSAQAIAYYSGDHSIEKLSGLSGEELKRSLFSLMSDTATGWVSYKNLTKYWVYTDAEDGKAGTVLFYADEYPITGRQVAKENTTISREHVWPKAHASFHESGGGADLHHLRPSDSIVNSKRGDFCMGTVDKSAKSTEEILFDGKVVGWRDKAADRFEPLDNVKGDIARIYLYVYVRWEEPNLFTDDASKQEDGDKNDGRRVIDSLDTLLAWIEADPVDTWEMSRNDLIEQVQGNRNVFIDHPEYAWSLFGLEAPEDVKIAAEDTQFKIPATTVTSKTLKTSSKYYKIKFTDLAEEAVVKYKSSDPGIAKVTKKGRIYPVSKGTATITVTIRQNGRKYTSQIKVKVK